MARLTDVSFEIASSTYKLALDFDDAALMQETIAFDVTAECVGGRLPRHSIRARVEIIPAKDTMVIYIGGKEMFRTDVFDHASTPVEQFIQTLPAPLFGGDPILGCAIKAGLSSVIGQAIDCCGKLEANSRWRVLTEYLHCMTKNFGKISRVAMFRAFRCIAGADAT
jgi:hypothetical protein